MKWLTLLLILPFASTAQANDGDYASAQVVEITEAAEGAPDGQREGFWLVGLGGSDLVDGYRIVPAPGAGDRIAIVGATEDNSPVPVTLELVKRFGGQVVATADLMAATSFTDWVVDAPFYLRVSTPNSAEQMEILVGVRIIPKSGSGVVAPNENSPDAAPRTLPVPQDEKAPVPKLVVPRI